MSSSVPFKYHKYNIWKWKAFHQRRYIFIMSHLLYVHTYKVKSDILQAFLLLFIAIDPGVCMGAYLYNLQQRKTAERYGIVVIL